MIKCIYSKEYFLFTQFTLILTIDKFFLLLRLEAQLLSKSRNFCVLISGTSIVNPWMKEVRDKDYCPENVEHAAVATQQACQDLCKARGKLNCSGISYSNTAKNRPCFLCKDDVLVKSGDGFHFYRRPGTF